MWWPGHRYRARLHLENTDLTVGPGVRGYPLTALLSDRKGLVRLVHEERASWKQVAVKVSNQVRQMIFDDARYQAIKSKRLQSKRRLKAS